MKKRLIIICAVFLLFIGNACQDDLDEVQVEEVMTAPSTNPDDDDEDDPFTPEEHNGVKG